MTIHHLARPAGLPFRTAAVLVFLLAGASAAAAGPRHAPRRAVPTTYDAVGALDRDRTGSINAVRNPVAPPHALRSSTLGNAEFPERDPIAQNLGNTAGGGLN